MPDLYIIAGPNGAGKTTIAETLLPEFLNCVEYVNADNIARGISPFNPESVAFHAGRVMLERMNDLVKRKIDFAFETTLSAKSYVSFLKHCKKKGYSITLVFIYLDSVETAKQRVKSRVEKGGHNIPEKIIERRYFKGLENFSKFVNLCEKFFVFNNSGGKPVLVISGNNSETTHTDNKIFNQLFQ